MSSQPLDSLTATLIRSSVVPLWARWEKSAYLKHIAFLNQNQYRPAEDIEKEQRQKLSALLDHAYDNCPYYQTILNSVSPDPAQLMARFSEIPILTKEDIRKNKDQMCARNFPKGKLIPKKTSGSTGVSLELFMDVDCSEWRRAVAIFRNSWTGWRLGEKTAAVWGNPPPAANWRAFLRNALLERCIYLDTLGMDENDMAFFLKELPRYQPTLMMGHAYSLYLFAKFVEQHPRAPKPILKGIISTAMILYPWQREAIERVFHCKIFERYGCEEVSLIASECEAHSGMHINTDSLIIEFLNGDGRPAMEGEETSVVVTDLMNYGMPIIRYRIGDKAVFTNHACSCGRKSMLITKVTGRDADFIVTPDGKIISGISLTENFSLKIPGVEQMQIEQLRRDHLKIKIVRDPGFNEGSELLLTDLSKRTFGDQMQWETVFVDKIPQEKNGKYRFVISHLEKRLSGNSEIRD